MSAKFFYLYIIFGVVFLLLVVYDLLQVHRPGNLAIINDLVVGCLLLYMGYKAYMKKKDQELM